MTTTNDDNLRAALARIRPGDEVTVRVEYDGYEGTLSGAVWPEAGGLTVVHTRLRIDDGAPGLCVREVLSHTPAPPLPATVADLDAAGTWAVATDGFKRHWVKDEDGMWTHGGIRLHARDFINVYGPIILRTDGEQA